MSIFAKIFGYLLGLIFSLVQDYGIAIILFTLLTKLILMPFTIKQIKSSKAMAEIQPKIKEIQDKYKGNQEKQNQLLMELYKEHNYNPLMGCLPLLIQFPIIIGLFTALRQPETYVFVNNPELLATATQDFFLWVPNLSQPDLMSNIWASGPSWFTGLPGLLPITSAALTYVQMKSMNKTTQVGDNPMNNQMKYMAMILPVMILMWGKTMSAGLILYWTVGNIFQIGQQYFMNRQTKGEA